MAMAKATTYLARLLRYRPSARSCTPAACEGGEWMGRRSGGGGEGRGSVGGGAIGFSASRP